MPKKLTLLVILFFFLPFCFAQNINTPFVPTPPKEPKHFCKEAEKFYALMEKSKSYVEITSLEGLVLDLRYGSFENFSGHDLYCGGKRAFLHRDAEKKLKKAIQILKQDFPGFTFVIFDAARPLYAQETLRKTVRNTPYSHFVSSPNPGGMHNFGLALDLTLKDSNGVILDMGTDFDSFEAAAGKQGEKEALKTGRLLPEQVKNREILRQIMKKAGFIALPSEWWHFNAYPSKYVRENYNRLPF